MAIVCVLVIGGELKEFNDSIEVNGMVFNKPFVEKPVSAEDHNVYLYFPSTVGAGSQQIFRKVSEFDKNAQSDKRKPVSGLSNLDPFTNTLI